MRTIFATPLLVGCLIVGMAGTATARPVFTCPNGSSGFERLDPQGAWDATVVGIVEMGLSVGEFAAGQGLTAAELETFYKEDVFGYFDVNGNGFVCLKDLPNTPGNPGVKFNAVDDNAAR